MDVLRRPEEVIATSVGDTVAGVDGERSGRPTDPAEKEILMEGLGTPLRDLQRHAGNPAQALIAERADVSEGTVGNVLNGRHLIKCDHVVSIAKYLGGEPEEWRQRWVDTFTRLENCRATDPSPGRPAPIPHTPEEPAALSEPAAVSTPATPKPAPPHEHVVPPQPPRPRQSPDSPPAPASPGTLAARTRRRTIYVAILVVVGVSVLIGIPTALALSGGSTTAPQGQPADSAAAVPTSPAASTAPSAADLGRREPVAGQPVYKQCSTAPRSIVSEPGEKRGGERLGWLKPGELFVVTAKTRYWKYGQVVGDPSRKGWVMSVNLCAVPGQTPSP